MIHLVTGDIKVEPSASGKITTFFQMMTVVSILIRFKYAYIVWNLTVILTIISAIDYIIKGSRLFNETNPKISSEKF